MVIDKPHINRDRVLQTEARRASVRACLEQIVPLLHPGERLGPPERRGLSMVIPIQAADEDDPPAGSPGSPVAPN